MGGGEDREEDNAREEVAGVPTTKTSLKLSVFAKFHFITLYMLWITYINLE